MLVITVFAVFAALLLTAAANDLRSYLIPNWISLALIASFAVFAPFAIAPGAVIWHVAAMFIALGIGLGLLTFGWIGGGDAKLFAAIALWMGWTDLMSFALAATIAGGAVSVGLLLSRRLAAGAAAGPSAPWLQRLLSKDEGVPYGVALAAGGIMAAPGAVFFQALG